MTDDAKTCRGPKCTRAAVAKGLCDTHLHQLYRTGRLWEIGNAPPRRIRCADCGTEGPHYALGRCNPCYRRFRRRRHARLARPAAA